jgi:hypothetical protein
VEDDCKRRFRFLPPYCLQDKLTTNRSLVLPRHPSPPRQPADPYATTRCCRKTERWAALGFGRDERGELVLDVLVAPVALARAGRRGGGFEQLVCGQPPPARDPGLESGRVQGRSSRLACADDRGARVLVDAVRAADLDVDLPSVLRRLRA